MSNPRSIDEIIDLPRSELTDEEIDLLIDWKASIKARDEAYQQRMELQRQANEEALRITRETAQEARQALNVLVNKAIDKWEEVKPDGIKEEPAQAN